MPPGTPYDSLIHPYNIRVDAFSSTPTITRQPCLHLLTHTHTDHTVGLSAKSFASTVVCSFDAKQMLLRHEVYKERELYATDTRGEKAKTYSHLKIEPTIQSDGNVLQIGCRDLLKPIPMDTPTVFELEDNMSVTITLIDANHCPGAVMFLVEGPQGAVLHTGDVRAEARFMYLITRNEYLSPYLANPPKDVPFDKQKRLEYIYLDTACLLSSMKVPSKEDACQDLIMLMRMFPEDTTFFLNCWTWGYEDILSAVSLAFRAKIHVDRYKHEVYCALRSDPALKSAVTQNVNTRFHACERFDRCSNVARNIDINGNVVVYINPAPLNAEKWSEYLKETKLKLSEGRYVKDLVVPLSRHSPLPELQSFVSAFKPRHIVPNTLNPALQGLDWLMMRDLFPDVDVPIDTAVAAEPESFDVAEGCEELQNAELKNLEGDTAVCTAEQWTGDDRLRKKLALLQDRLTGRSLALVKGLLAKPPRPVMRPRVARWNDDDNDSDYDEDGRHKTAHRLFAHFPGVRENPAYPGTWSSPSHSTAMSSPLMQHGGSNSAHPLMTPDPSPVRRPLKRGVENDVGSSSVKKPRRHLQQAPLPLQSPIHLGSPPRPNIRKRSQFSPLERNIKNLPTVTFPPTSSSKHKLKRAQLPMPLKPQSSSRGSDRRSLTNNTQPLTAIPIELSPPLTGKTYVLPSEMGKQSGVVSCVAQGKRHALRALRSSIAERLSLARPDLVASSYSAPQTQKRLHKAKQSN